MAPTEFPLHGKEYRLPKFYLVLGIVCSVFFAVAGIVSSVAAFLNLDGSFLYPVPTAIVFAAFWSGFTLLGVWLILAYSRERLFVTPRLVRSTGCFSIRELQLTEVVRAAWKPILRGGGLVLYGLTGKITIHFGNFPATEQVELIDFFRASIPQDVQERWDRFEACCVPHSPSFHKRQDRDRLRSYILMPIFGLALIALSVWDP
jgi:hypothetical protein